MIDKNDGLTLECDSIHSRNCSLSYSFIVLYFERPPIAFRLKCCYQGYLCSSNFSLLTRLWVALRQSIFLLLSDLL